MTSGFNPSNAIGKSLGALNNSQERLSSGKRINRASDDAAGLAIVSSLESETRTAAQAVRNASDGISVANVADSALGNISDITARQQELATQAANGTLSDEQRSTLNNEFQQLSQERDRILSTTEFNGQKVFNNEGTTLQVGTGSDANSQIKLPSVDTSSLSTSSLDISTQDGAKAAIDNLNDQTQSVASRRGEIGAAVSRVDVASNSAQSQSTEAEAAASRIRDADIADEAAKSVAAKILVQGSTAVAAQGGKLTADMVQKLLQ